MVGFMPPQGPSAYVDGKLYFSNGKGEPEEINLARQFPGDFARYQYHRAEFKGSGLQMSAIKTLLQGKTVLWGLRIEGSDIADNKVGGLRAAHLGDVDSMGPQPQFSDNGRFGMLAAHQREHAPAAALTALHLDLELYQGPGKPDMPLPIGRAAIDQGSLINAHATFSFIAPSAVLVKQAGKGMSLWTAGPGTGTVGAYQEQPIALDQAGPQPAGLADSMTRLERAYTPWVYSPIGGTMIGDTLRTAWLTEEGVWVTDSALGKPASARPIPGLTRALLSGEQGGTQMDFSVQGDYLILQQRPFYAGSMRVRVWNIGRARHNWIMHQASPAQLQQLACAIVKGSPGRIADVRATIMPLKLDRNSEPPCQ
jgi:hypothetical protein